MGRHAVADKNTPMSISLPQSLQERLRLYLADRNAKGEAINASALLKKLLVEHLDAAAPVTPQAFQPMQPTPQPRFQPPQAPPTPGIQTFNNGLPDGISSDEEWAELQAAARNEAFPSQKAMPLSVDEFMRSCVRPDALAAEAAAKAEEEADPEGVAKRRAEIAERLAAEHEKISSYK